MKIYFIAGTNTVSSLPDLHYISIEFFLKNIPVNADAFLILETDFEVVSKILSQIRKHPLTNIYLAPVFFITSSDNDHLPFELNFFDDVFYSEKINLYIAEKSIELCSRIKQKIGDIPNSRDTSIPLKVIRFMYSRDKTLIPNMTSNNISGYVYPRIVNFLYKDDFTVFKVFEFLEINNLISGKFHDIAYFCSNCSSAFLNFREICPKCNSANLNCQDLIHHFKCAHVAPEEDFKTKDGLICPKCKDPLVHIGVDFDKPSIIFNCKNCGNIFQEPDTDTKCYNCKIANFPENQKKEIIKNYTLTGLGENACIHGIDSLFQSVLEEKLPLIPYKIFIRILESESERIRRYSKQNSSIVYLKIDKIETIYSELGSNAKPVFMEIASIIKSILRVSDFITALNESIFLSILTETDYGGAETALKRISKRIEDLIINNTQIKVNIITKIFLIDGIKSVKEITKEFLEL